MHFQAIKLMELNFIKKVISKIKDKYNYSCLYGKSYFYDKILSNDLSADPFDKKKL